MEQKPSFYYVALASVKSQKYFERLAKHFEALFTEGEKVDITSTLNPDNMVITFKAKSDEEIEPLAMKIFNDELREDPNVRLIYEYTNCFEEDPTLLVIGAVRRDSQPSYLYMVSGDADFGWWKDFFGKKAEAAVESTYNTHRYIMERVDEHVEGEGIVVMSGVHQAGRNLTVLIECRKPVPDDLKAKILNNFENNGMTILGVVLS